MLVALIGPDRYSVGVALHAYVEKYAPADNALGDLNVTRLDGARITPDDLSRAVQAIGFLAEQRVVVVEGLISRFGVGKAADGRDSSTDEAQSTPSKGRRADGGLADGFAGILGNIPDSTVLILVERGGVAKNNTLFKTASRYGKVEEYIPPRGASLERWIHNRCASLSVKIQPAAQASLAASMPDLQALSNELDKLALFVGEGGTIDERVLHQMSHAARQEDVFELTNAVARRDTKGALQQLHRLMEGGTAAEGILPVLAWQVRTLIQVRDMIDQRVPDTYMAEKSGISDYVVRKTVGQARQFSMPKLMQIHHSLLDLDHAVKTGRAEAELAIDSLVVQMCQS